MIVQQSGRRPAPGAHRLRLGVFVDASGRRSRWVGVLLRVFALGLLAAAGAGVLGLLGDVPLPGLQAPVLLPSNEPAHRHGLGTPVPGLVGRTGAAGTVPGGGRPAAGGPRSGGAGGTPPVGAGATSTPTPTPAPTPGASSTPGAPGASGTASTTPGSAPSTRSHRSSSPPSRSNSHAPSTRPGGKP